jgi:hypothetical protein
MAILLIYRVANVGRSADCDSPVDLAALQSSGQARPTVFDRCTSTPECAGRRVFRLIPPPHRVEPWFAALTEKHRGREYSLGMHRGRA